MASDATEKTELKRGVRTQIKTLHLVASRHRVWTLQGNRTFLTDNIQFSIYSGIKKKNLTISSVRLPSFVNIFSPVWSSKLRSGQNTIKTIFTAQL
jgi:hypothetical protein